MSRIACQRLYQAVVGKRPPPTACSPLYLSNKQPKRQYECRRLSEVPKPKPICLPGVKYRWFIYPYYRLLKKLNIDPSWIFKVKRFMIRYSYPWFSFCIPLAFMMGLGDIFAQVFKMYFKKEDFENALKDKEKALKEEKDKTLKNVKHKVQEKECVYNWCRTLAFAFVGFAVFGPLSSRWNIVVFRYLRCTAKAQYVATKVILDNLLIYPFAAALLIAMFDYENIRDYWPDYDELWEKKHKALFKDIYLTNLQTRVLVTLYLVYLAPPALRPYLRILYESMFAAYISHKIFDVNQMGHQLLKCPCLQTTEMCKSKTKPRC